MFTYKTLCYFLDNVVEFAGLDNIVDFNRRRTYVSVYHLSWEVNSSVCCKEFDFHLCFHQALQQV